MEKILKINNNPAVRTYQTLAYPLSVIYDADISDRLMCNYYIQVMYKDYFSFHDVVSFNGWFFDKFVIPKSIINISKLKPTEIIKKCITDDYYITTLIDEYYVPEKADRHNIHDILIYGFSESDNIFNIIGYTSKTDYRETTISSDDLEKALLNENGEVLPDQILCAKPLIENCHDYYNVDLLLIYNLIYDYVNSENSYYKDKYDYKPNSWLNDNLNHDFGIKAFDNLLKIIDIAISNNEELDSRDFRCFLEHKNTMLFRIKYLLEKNIIMDINDIFESYSEINNIANTVFNMIMKYNINKRIDILKRAKENIIDIRSKELNILPLFLEKIDKFITDNKKHII